MMKLLDVLRTINSLDEGSTVYATEPWTQDSTAIVEVEPDEGGLPVSAQERGMTYFLEVALIREFLLAWEATLGGVPTLEQKCTRLIQFATHDG